MNILISSLSQTPIYAQIQEQIKELVLTGKLAPGEQLPSVRALAKDLKVGIITVKRAYEELEQEGIVVNLQGRGCFVAEVDTVKIRAVHLTMLAQQIQEIKKSATAAGITKEEILSLVHQVYGGDGIE